MYQVNVICVALWFYTSTNFHASSDFCILKSVKKYTFSLILVFRLLVACSKVLFLSRSINFFLRENTWLVIWVCIYFITNNFNNFQAFYSTLELCEERKVEARQVEQVSSYCTKGHYHKFSMRNIYPFYFLRTDREPIKTVIFNITFNEINNLAENLIFLWFHWPFSQNPKKMYNIDFLSLFLNCIHILRFIWETVGYCFVWNYLKNSLYFRNIVEKWMNIILGSFLPVVT